MGIMWQFKAWDKILILLTYWQFLLNFKEPSRQTFDLKGEFYMHGAISELLFPPLDRFKWGPQSWRQTRLTSSWKLDLGRSPFFSRPINSWMSGGIITGWLGKWEKENFLFGQWKVKNFRMIFWLVHYEVSHEDVLHSTDLILQETLVLSPYIFLPDRVSN